MENMNLHYHNDAWKKLVFKVPSLSEKNKVENVIFNDPATIVLWEDGTKTVVKCQPGDAYSKEIGLAMCMAKKCLGNKSNFNNVFKKYIKEV